MFKVIRQVETILSVSVWTRSSDGHTEVCVYRVIRRAEAMSLCVCAVIRQVKMITSVCVYRVIRLRQSCRFESVQGHQTGDDDHVSLCVYKVIMCVCTVIRQVKMIM